MIVVEVLPHGLLRGERRGEFAVIVAARAGNRRRRLVIRFAAGAGGRGQLLLLLLALQFLLFLLPLALFLDEVHRVVNALGEPKVGARREDAPVAGEVEAPVVVEQDARDDRPGLHASEAGRGSFRKR